MRTCCAAALSKQESKQTFIFILYCASLCGVPRISAGYSVYGYPCVVCINNKVISDRPDKKWFPQRHWFVSFTYLQQFHYNTMNVTLYAFINRYIINRSFLTYILYTHSFYGLSLVLRECIQALVFIVINLKYRSFRK